MKKPTCVYSNSVTAVTTSESDVTKKMFFKALYKVVILAMFLLKLSDLLSGSFRFINTVNFHVSNYINL